MKITNPIKKIVCPKCKKKMKSAGNDNNDTYYCSNLKCVYCGINREIFPWEK